MPAQNVTVTANFILFAGGSGTAEDPYQIADWRQLDNVRNYLNHHFIVINDLDSNSVGYTELASPAANEGKGWQPIGTTAENDKFAGNFDGQGHEICDLFTDHSDESEVGLFGVVDEVGVIENVGLVNGNVTGNDDVGGLVGKNSDTAVSSSFWDTETSGMEGSAGGTGKTTEEMQHIATFSGAGWDIVLIGGYVDETWYIDDGNDYPRLGWQS